MSLHWGIHNIPRVLADYQRTVAHFLWSQREIGNHVPGHIGGHRHGVENDPAYPRLPMGPDAMKSMIAKAVLTTSGVERVSFMPVRIDTELRPEVLFSSDPRFTVAVDHIDWASGGLAHTFTVAGDEVVVTGAAG
ncbi:MAG: hypothetical protein Q7S35_12700 [Candidatus Limnocylindrales bacterium]|nr:hypothetical protein [Candidatus Limnocylindrales bacterium]